MEGRGFKFRLKVLGSWLRLSLKSRGVAEGVVFYGSWVRLGV